MTQRDKEWLIKIQQMQTELKDPYVDDYYNVTYTSRKIAAAAANDKDNKTTPSLLLPERPKPAVEPQTNSYIPVQFEGSLGKIQVSNVNCPRKLLDCTVNKTSTIINPNESMIDVKVANKSEVSKFRKLLLQIEKLYVVLLNIDDEDKRIGALPEEARKSHFETRKQLCDKLFKGLTNETQDKINLEVVQIKKGLALLFRSLSYLSDENQRAVIISDLLNATNYRQYVIKPKDRLDFGQMLVNAIYNINNHEVLLKIVSGINNIALIIKSEVRKLGYSWE
jgi:DNA topoisomerase 2-associated protein PAT1